MIDQQHLIATVICVGKHLVTMTVIDEQHLEAMKSFLTDSIKQ
jgi:hypothetical protein